MRIACASDLHWLFQEVKDFPEADVFVYAGDWSGYGTNIETMRFIAWLGGLPYSYKLVVPGNHERWAGVYTSWAEELFEEAKIPLLIDKEFIIDGVKFYGTPWTPIFRHWAFMKKDAQLDKVFCQIPEDTDVLITHGQPRGICDPEGYGSKALLKHVDRVQPKIHIFGHAHEGYGYQKYKDTHCYNVAMCSPSTLEYDNTYKLIHPITIIDI